MMAPPVDDDGIIELLCGRCLDLMCETGILQSLVCSMAAGIKREELTTVEREMLDETLERWADR